MPQAVYKKGVVNAQTGVTEVVDMTPAEVTAFLASQSTPSSADAIPSETVLQSPNGTPFRLMVDDSGTIITQEVQK